MSAIGDRDLRARVVWACPELTMAQRALYDLLRRLERGGAGAHASAAFLAECLTSTERTVATDRWELRRLGLLELRQESRRQVGTWTAVLPAACIPATAEHAEILRCAQLLAEHVRGARVHPTVKSRRPRVHRQRIREFTPR